MYTQGGYPARVNELPAGQTGRFYSAQTGYYPGQFQATTPYNPPFPAQYPNLYPPPTNYRNAQAMEIGGPIPSQNELRVPDGFTIDGAIRYGRMPNEMLAVKFEETDMGYDEGDAYDSYARNTLMDRRPDAPLTASDEARRSDWSGRLNLQYSGSRGTADPPAHPEMFLGEIDRDPRGHVDEPDMKQMPQQWQARTRFQRWSPDDQASTTSGGRSEPQLMRDIQSGFKWVRERLKIFSRQLDGRRLGKSGRWKHVSRAARFDGHRPRGDYVGDGVQIRRSIIERYSVRETRAFRDGATDSDMAVAVMGQARRQGRAKNSQQRGRVAAQDGRFGLEAMSQQYKTAASMIADLVAIRDKMVSAPRDHDGVEAEPAIESMARKHESMAKDLVALMQNVVQDGDLGLARETIIMKAAAMKGAGPATGAPIVFNHLVPEHLLHIGEKMYKAAKMPRDQRAIESFVARDGTPAKPSIEAANAKSGRRHEDPTVIVRKIVGELKDSTMGTYSYKQRRVQAPTANGVSGEDFASESDKTQDRRSRLRGGTGHDAKARKTTKYDAMKFSDNYAPVRHGGHFGNKTMVRRAADREIGSSSLAEI